ncbi:cytochrome c oxidase assembly factor 5 [Lycorma delicatula]|uniref:cytochrome c oxidase assembly factor 5 n=1 Tax=Lycorma delicatula TaxID=130591 RepID=UPI003F519B8F
MVLKYTEEEAELEDHSPCATLKAELKMCVLETDCCKIEKKTPRECLRSYNVPQDCIALRNAFFECKRSFLDNRQRFRGRKMLF